MNKIHTQGFALIGVLVVSLLINRGLPSGNNHMSAVSANESINSASVIATVSQNKPELPSTQTLAIISSPIQEQPQASAEISVSPPLQQPSNIPEPKVQVTAAFVQEIGYPFPLFARDPIRRWPLASITKLMTAIIAEEEMDPRQEITIAETDVATDGVSGNFLIGERFTVGDLLNAMLLASSNDAAEALARTYGRSEFIERMNAKAIAIGLTKTTFIDPTGLSVLNQTTAADVSLLASYVAQKHPEVFAITRKTSTTVTNQKNGSQRTLLTTNHFAGDARFIGGKTGYTEEAAGNLVSVFRVEGKDIVIVVLGTKDRFEQTKILFDWVRQVL